MKIETQGKNGIWQVLDGAFAAAEVADALDGKGKYDPVTYRRADAVASGLRRLARIALLAADLREALDNDEKSAPLILLELEAVLDGK